MATFKMLLVLAALLFVSVCAVPDVDYSIHEINVLDDDEAIGDGIYIEGDGIDLEEIDGMTVLRTTERAPREKAVFAVKKVEAGFARTTNVGLTVQKGTAGIIKFRIRLKAVTAEQLAVLAKLFAKSLTKAQVKQLTKLQNSYDGQLAVPWLKLLGIDLSKSSSRKDLIKARAKIANFDQLAIKAKLLLKEVVAQKIEVKGVLKAKGVSFIPTTVFSFIRIAKVYFEDDSTLLVLSDHPGDVATASKDGGKVVPHEVESLEIL